MNRNQLLQQCSEELSQSRAKAQAVAYSNLSKARANEQFSLCEKQERSLVFELGKARANNENTKVIEVSLEKLRAQKSKILREMSLTTADLSPSYSCKECNDIGYIGMGMCKCLKAKLNKKIIENCNAGKSELCDFKDFNTDIVKDDSHKTQLLKLKKKFEDVAVTYPNIQTKFMVISGKTGVGKTFLTECLAKALIERNYLVSFITAFGMNNIFLSYHTCHDEQKYSYLSALIEPDILFIDDLGTEPVLKNVTKEYLLVLLSERARLNKLTIVTTNLDANELLQRYEERIFSRLFNKRESFTTKIIGQDLRLINNAN